MEMARKKQKIYTAFDGKIEVGMLVQCVKDDNECKRGDIRRVSWVLMPNRTNFEVNGRMRLPGFLRTDRWRPIVRLPDGCLQDDGRMRNTSHPEVKHGAVFRVKESKPHVAWKVDDVVKLSRNDNSRMPGFEQFEGKNAQYTFWHQLRPVMPVELVPEEKPEPAGVSLSDGFKAFVDGIEIKDARKKLLLAELVLECLNCDGNMVSLLSFSRHGKISGRRTLNVWHDAKCHPDDTPSALIGSIVALSKALNKDIPKWVFD